jgi:hypothetical protein
MDMIGLQAWRGDSSDSDDEATAERPTLPFSSLKQTADAKNKNKNKNKNLQLLPLVPASKAKSASSPAASVVSAALSAPVPELNLNIAALARRLLRTQVHSNNTQPAWLRWSREQLQAAALAAELTGVVVDTGLWFCLWFGGLVIISSFLAIFVQLTTKDSDCGADVSYIFLCLKYILFSSKTQFHARTRARACRCSKVIYLHALHSTPLNATQLTHILPSFHPSTFPPFHPPTLPFRTQIAHTQLLMYMHSGLILASLHR